MAGFSPAEIGTGRPGSRIAMMAPVLTAAVACALLGAFSDQVNPVLEYSREGLQSLQAWRLVTAHLAHLGALHGALNGAALVLVWYLGRRTVSGVEWAWLCLGAAAAVDAGLYWLSPGIAWYVGASGVLHGLFGGVAVFTLGRGARSEGLLLLLALAAKLAWEGFGQTSPLGLLGGTIPVVTEAHVYGAAGGVVSSALLQVLRQRA